MCVVLDHEGFCRLTEELGLDSIGKEKQWGFVILKR